MHWMGRVIISQTSNGLLCSILVIHTFPPSCFSDGGDIISFMNFCDKIMNTYNFVRTQAFKVKSMK